MTWFEGFYTFMRILKMERMQTVSLDIYKISKVGCLFVYTNI